MTLTLRPLVRTTPQNVQCGLAWGALNGTVLQESFS